MAQTGKRFGIIGSAIALFLVVAMIATAVLSVGGANFITMWWSSFSETGNTTVSITHAEAIANTKAVSVQTMEEGAVLLRNENSTLPLSAGTKINLFGYRAFNEARIVGSSDVGSEDLTTISLPDALNDAGFQINESLYTWEQNNSTKEDFGNIFNMSLSYTVKEFDFAEMESAGIIAQAKDFSDVAVYVIGRNAGEKQDAAIGYDGQGNEGEDKNYLQLVETERAMLEGLTKNFSKVIVILNTATAFEVGALEDYNVEACLYVGTYGTVGAVGVANILKGDANPSGHLPFTFSYDVTDNPAYYTYGDNTYANADQWGDLSLYANKRITQLDDNYANYTHYYEGIYVGYRYYETRYIGDDNVYTPQEEAEYQKHVQYPFGYGMSYTTFSWSDPVWNVGSQGGEVSVSVKVTNTGSVAGKDVVQLYYTAPYTPGGIEKSAVELAGYAKTKLLQPGESDTVTITMNFDDMASYDYQNERAYVLDAGEYILSLRSDAHTVKDGLTNTFQLAKKIVYNDANDGKRSTDKVAAVNQFDTVSAGDGSIVYVTRADWEGTMPTVRDELKTVNASQSVIDAILSETAGCYVDGPSEDESKLSSSAEWITTSANNGMTVSDVAGLTDYDDPLWDDLLDNVSIEEMRELYGDGAYRVSSVNSIEMKRTVDADGPTGLNATSIGQYGSKVPAPAIWACTFNDELIEEVGAALADEWLLAGAVGMYGPSINLMRTAFNGRNGEYISECPLLTGKIAAAYTRGAQNKGCYVYLKHYAAYGVASHASAMCWLNEQAIREIYTRAFEIGIKEADAHGTMISFGKMGTSLNTCNYALLTTLPYEEWGFTGAHVSDGIGTSAWDPNLGLRAGLGMILDASWDGQMISWGEATVDKSVTESNYGQHLLRENAKRLIYRYANSAAIGTIRTYSRSWVWLIVGLEVLMAAGVVCSVMFLVKPAFFPKKKGSVRVIKREEEEGEQS